MTHMEYISGVKKTKRIWTASKAKPKFHFSFGEEIRFYLRFCGQKIEHSYTAQYVEGICLYCASTLSLSDIT